MPKIIPLNFRITVSKLKKLGFNEPIYGGKHPILKKEGLRIPVPKHGGKDVSSGVIAAIIKQLGISIKERDNL